jgi:hypothetical protein
MKNGHFHPSVEEALFRSPGLARVAMPQTSNFLFPAPGFSCLIDGKFSL